MRNSNFCSILPEKCKLFKLKSHYLYQFLLLIWKCMDSVEVGQFFREIFPLFLSSESSKSLALQIKWRGLFSFVGVMSVCWRSIMYPGPFWSQIYIFMKPGKWQISKASNTYLSMYHLDRREFRKFSFSLEQAQIACSLVH